MFKAFLQDPEETARTADFVVSFVLFGGPSRGATKRRVTVRTCSESRALRIVKREYRRSGDHRVVGCAPLLAAA